MFFETPNVLADADWVYEQGGVAEVYKKIQEEIKDFCYFLSTEIQTLPLAHRPNQHQLIH